MQRASADLYLFLLVKNEMLAQGKILGQHLFFFIGAGR